MTVAALGDSFPCRAVILSILLVFLSWLDSSTHDEPEHLAAGISDWQVRVGELYYVNPPLVRMIAAIPASCALDVTPLQEASHSRSLTLWGGGIGARLWAQSAVSAEQWLRWGRLMLIPILILGLYATERLALRLYGPRAASLAGWLFVSCPNLLAAGHSIAADGVCAALLVTSCWLFQRWLDRPTVIHGIAAGLVLGLALLTKTLVLLLLPCFGIAWILDCIAQPDWRRAMARSAVPLMLIGYLALLTLWTGYAWRGIMQPLAEFRFVSQSLTGNARGDLSGASEAAAGFGNRFQGTLLGSLPIPLPAMYVYGIDRQKADFERSIPILRHGHWRTGRWTDQLYAFLIKVPLGVLGLVLFWLMSLVLSRDRVRREPRSWLVAILAITILGVNLSQTGITIYFRYLVPLFPLLYILLGRLVDSRFHGRFPGWCRRVAGVLVVAAVVESGFAFPHLTAFGNALVGGPWRAQKFYLGANECGQNLWRLAAWAHSIPAGDELYLCESYQTRFLALSARGSSRLPSQVEARSRLHDASSGLFRPGWYVSTEYNRNPPRPNLGNGYLREFAETVDIAPGLSASRLTDLDIRRMISKILQQDASHHDEMRAPGTP